MRNEKVVVMVESAIAAAIAFVLSELSFSWLPNGGSLSLQMVPIFVVAFRRGPAAGFISGALLGVLSIIFGGYVVHFAQVVFDYPLPFALLGLAGYFRNQRIVGMIVGGLGRYLSHVLAGVWFWGAYAPENMNVWWYSITYNASYLIPELIVTIVVVYFLSRRRDLFEAK